MVRPRYHAIEHAIEKDTAPTVNLDNATARIIAGNLQGTTEPAKSYSPMNLWDVSLPTHKGSTVSIPYSQDDACIVFVCRGSVAMNDTKFGPEDVALLKNDDKADSLQLSVREKDLLVLIMDRE